MYDELARVADRQDVIRARLAAIGNDPGATEASHGPERDALIEEYGLLRRMAGRAARVGDIRRLAGDPANREGGWEGGFDGTRDRLESPGQVIQRVGNPWAGEADDSTAGLIARCHTAIEGLSERLTDGGAEKLAQLLTVRPPGRGPYEIRTEQDVRRSAELILAATSPHYESAFGHILRDPMAFRSGAGHLRWSDDEREAFARVEISRAALFEDTGTGGQYLLPFVLDDTVLLTNAGSANPWRRVCKTVTTVSKTWNGATSAGVNAAWYAEGATNTDATPTLAQLVITPHTESAWAFASYEAIGDTRIGERIPALMDDAFSRLESAAFTTGAGDGSNAPWGAITRATVDGSTGLVSVANAVSVFSLLNNIPVRFRDPGSGARPYWACNIAVLNALRAVTAFAAATESIVDDSTTPPKMFGIPVLESSDMDASNATGGHKNLLLFDANSFLVCERLGTTILYEPMYKDQATGRPNREGGWLAWRRVGSEAVTATALRVHNNA
jgi:HK97 family phage major capsid protein